MIPGLNPWDIMFLTSQRLPAHWHMTSAKLSTLNVHFPPKQTLDDRIHPSPGARIGFHDQFDPPTCRKDSGGCAAHDLCYNVRMNAQLKSRRSAIRRGNPAEELLAHLETSIGQTLSVAKTPRGIELSAPEADFDAQMEVAREVMARRKRAGRTRQVTHNGTGLGLGCAGRGRGSTS
jgi:hypothetical protein